MVANVTTKAVFAVLVHGDKRRSIIKETNLDKAMIWPKTNISIICMAKTSNPLFHKPDSQEFATATKRCRRLPSKFPKKKAKHQVNTVRITAIVNGAGKTAFTTLINRSLNVMLLK